MPKIRHIRDRTGLVRSGRRKAAKAAPDDLLAEKLGAEGADAEDVRHGIGVPALGEHRDRDDAADLLAELAGLPTVFMTSRSRSSSVELVGVAPGKRAGLAS